VTKKLVGYGVVGLVIAIALIAGLQDRPQNFLPSMGTLQLSIARDPSTSDPLSVTCHGMRGSQVQNLTTLVVDISSVQVHRTGALNLTGDWLNVNATPGTVDLLQLKSLNQLGSISLTDGVINLVRLNVSSTASAATSTGSVSVTVSSSHLDAQVNAQVTSGKVTSITLEVIQPHVVCQGNGDFRLTPELTATSEKTD
jgi:uncharacterized protein DUF4382